MSGSLLSAFGKAVSFTARGATVTFGSTVFSCVAACSIEKGANRMILKYYPHKFANVESASGITKEELDFVKMMYGGRIVADANQETDSDSSTTTSNTDSEVLFRFDSFEDSDTLQASQADETKVKPTMSILLTERNTTQEQEDEKFSANKFWTEGEEAASKALSLIPAIIVQRQEILACSMTA